MNIYNLTQYIIVFYNHLIRFGFGKDEFADLERMEIFVRNKNKMKVTLFILILLLVVVIFYILINTTPSNNELDSINETLIQENENQIAEVGKENTIDSVLPEIQIHEQYIKNVGNSANLYYIDDQNVLWGAGENQYGQLGIGIQDNEYHTELVKIAEDVIHVDYSEHGFVIYLTSDGKLYGFGNGGTGALQQSANYSSEQYYNGYNYAVTSPLLLLEEVTYARCGRDDIAAIKDSAVYIWGIIWYQTGYEYLAYPTKVLDNALLVTGGMYNHAALLADGSVWTWGYNYTGNCGVSDNPVISLPTKVAEDVLMVWTSRLTNNLNCYDINEVDKHYTRPVENTIIKKTDGSYWICGINVGNVEKVLPIYYEIADFSVVCSSEFHEYNGTIE